MQKNENPPDALVADGEGARLWLWLHSECEGIEASEPLVTELCLVKDRLQEVRAKIKTIGLWVSGSKKNPMLDIELKLVSSFNRLWKQLGLSDKPEDGAPRRPVGRPPAGEENLWPD